MSEAVTIDDTLPEGTAQAAASKFMRSTGFWFRHKDDLIEIEVFCSFFSALEVVYVNGEEISRQRRFQFNSWYPLEQGGHQYQVALLAGKQAKGEYECVVFRGEQVVSRQSKSIAGKNANNKKFMYAVVGAGFLTGLAIAIIPRLF